MEKFCSKCGNEINKKDKFCAKCGYQLKEDKDKFVAGMLGIFLGAFGAHSFYLGDVKKAITQLVITVCTGSIGGIIGVVEGILILTGTMKIETN